MTSQHTKNIGASKKAMSKDQFDLIAPTDLKTQTKDRNLMMQILEDLTLLNRVFCSTDYDRSIDYLKEILPFKVHSYTNRDEYNGWTIPPKWDVKEAKIFKDGKVVYDGLKHPLRVVSLSTSCHVTLSLHELKCHLHYDHRYDDAIPYHFRQMYRSWDRDWGFCVTKNFFDSLEPGRYEVLIETEESEGILKVLDLTHQGALPETFAFGAHLDHPGMANDDLAGCAVGVNLFKHLAKRKTKYTYKLILVQEIIGSEYYFGKTNVNNKENILEGLWLEMLGSGTPLALQHSMEGESNMEHAALHSIQSLRIPFKTFPFRGLVNNDEHIWEAYEIPMASLSRAPYPEYHTDRDSFSLMSDKALNESLNVLLGVIDWLESTKLVFKHFQGNICLSNPKYDLYVDVGRPEFGTWKDEHTQKLRLLMDLIPTMRRPVTTKCLSDLVKLDEKMILPYLKLWQKKGLLAIR